MASAAFMEAGDVGLCLPLIPSVAEILALWRDACPDAGAERVCRSAEQLGVRTDQSIAKA